MKIQKIGIGYNNKQEYNRFLKNRSASTHFCAIPAPLSDVIEAKIYAEKIKDSSKQVFEKGNSYIKVAYDELEKTKESYKQAILYLNLIKKGFQDKKIPIDLTKNIEAITTLKNGRLQTSSIKVFDPNGTRVQDIFFENNIPTKIIDYLSDDEVRIATFNYDKVTISSCIDTKSKDVDACYIFRYGKLSSVKTNITNVPFATLAEDFFVYVNDELFVNEHDTRSLFTGQYNVKERFNFQNSQLTNYYRNFFIDEFRCYSWAESCHFNQSHFIGKTIDAIQKSKYDNIIAKSSIYLINKTFFNSKNTNCEISDNSLAKFFE